MMMAMKPHQMLLLLLLLLLLFIANLPPCSSRYIQSFREARRDAYSDQRGRWRGVNLKSRFVKQLVDRAARQADVTSAEALQGFYEVC